MALPTLDELRQYLRIETTVEDDLLQRLLAQSVASVEAYIRQPIEARVKSFPLYPVPADWAGMTWGSYSYGLQLPFAPIGSPVVVTQAGVVVSDSDYTVDAASGTITPAASAPFTIGALYRVSAPVGLSLLDDYETAVEPAISAAIIDWAADLYQRRNPAASYESGGGGVAVNYNETASKTMPSRIRVTLDPWRRVLV